MESKIFDIIKNNYHKLTCLTGYEKSVFDKILNCKTEHVPSLFTRCDTCSTIHPVYKSCKDRMCPVCNGSASLKWTAKRESELLQTGYFLLTYTIPSQLRTLFLANKKICYNLLFKAVSRSILDGVKNNDRKFNGKTGFFAMLHTWDQRLNYHPHLHIVVPGGCISADNTKWIDSNPSFFLPVKKMSADFRKRLLFYLSKEHRAGRLNIPAEIDDFKLLLSKLKKIPWVANSQAPGKKRNNSKHILRYLSRYVSKTAVSENRIKKIENGNVYLSYYDRKKKQGKTEIISEENFLRRLTMHILPKGFKKVRFYGFMANRYRANNLALCKMLQGQPLTEQVEESNELLNDAAFLFWKYFGIDITLCRDCGKGHISYLKSSKNLCFVDDG